MPAASVEFANILLTTEDAAIGQTPKDVVWTHRKATLYRYRSSQRVHSVPVLLVFALINRPDIFDLTPGRSFVEFLLEEGLRRVPPRLGQPGDEDSDMGVDDYVCDQLPWAMRETLRAAGAEELTLVGWCIGGTLCAMHGALRARRARRGTSCCSPRRWTRAPRACATVGAGRGSPSTRTPVDRRATRRSRAARWTGRTRLMKPVTGFFTTAHRRLFELGAQRRDRGRPCGLPADGQVGRATTRRFPGSRLPGVDHLDVQE
ncbi:MAG: hypothetical protein WKF31_13150 [Thermoleophilaceae bacterium]